MRVVALHVRTKKSVHPERVPEARAIVDRGIERDHAVARAAGGKRQVLILERAILAELHLEPGDLREQILIEEGLDLMHCTAGTRVEIGEATFELVQECEPCRRIGTMLGVADPEAFRLTLVHRRGMLARVVREGVVREGDRVLVTANAR